MLLGRLENILGKNVDIADFQEQLSAAVNEKDKCKRSAVLSKSKSPIFFLENLELRLNN
jgi:hypothetical protein